MSVFKNITQDTLTVELNGPGKKATVVEPGKLLTVNDDLDYIVGVLVGADQVEKVDVEAKAAPAAPTAK